MSPERDKRAHAGFAGSRNKVGDKRCVSQRGFTLYTFQRFQKRLSEAQEKREGPIDRQQCGIVEMPKNGSDLIPRHRVCFIHHDLRSFQQAILGQRLHGHETEEYHEARSSQVGLSRKDARRKSRTAQSAPASACDKNRASFQVSDSSFGIKLRDKANG